MERNVYVPGEVKDIGAVGYYGAVKIGGKRYEIRFFATLKSECQKWAEVLKKDGYITKVIKHPIQLGTLAGGATYEHWAVAVRKEEWK